MYLAINDTEIAHYPSEFRPTILDLDNADTTARTANGRFTRDRVAVKRQIEMSWAALKWEDLSAILQAMADESFNFTYPDPMTGTQQTKNFYVGNRTAPYAFTRNGVTWWDGLQLTITET